MEYKKVPIEILPGLFTEQTRRGAVKRWRDGNHVRFYNGQPQKIGGWQKATPETFEGKARGVSDWLTLRLERIAAFGTHLKLYIQKGGSVNDITPIRDSGTLGADPFSTSNGLAIVTVTDNSHGLTVGDYVRFSGAAAVAGITISGEYNVTEILNGNSYTITHSAPANATTTGGGATVAYEYEINVGNEDSVAGLGWGAGGWGGSTWGTPRSTSTILWLARTWSLDHWGEDLIANPRSGGIYVWDSSAGTSSRATLISGAPSSAKSIIISPQNRHLIALGAHDGSNDDPMLVRWCSSEDYTDWTPTDLNTAGEKRLDGGSEIYMGMRTDREILIFTDRMLYSMLFEGPPYIFSFSERGDNGKIVGPMAAKEYGGIIYWMGEKDFWYYDGRIQVLPCDVATHVFDDINVVQKAKIFAGANRTYGEVWWLYPSANSTECDRYVLYCPSEKAWSYGTLDRTMIVGDSPTFDTPYGFGIDGYIYDHETGVDDEAVALDAFIESYDMEIGSGDSLMMTKNLIPDFQTLSGSVDVTLRGRKYPHGAQKTKGPVTITSADETVGVRMRARQLSVYFESDGIGDNWRVGTMRLELREAGGR